LRSDPDGAVIGSGLARKLNVGVGGNFTFITSTGATQPLRVVAIFESGIASFDDRRGLINLALAQTLGHMPRNAVSGLSIQVRDLERIDEAKYAVQTATGYRTESWEESNAQILDFQGRQQITTRILVIFVFITALFGNANTLVAIVLQKRLDIAVMKSFGVTRGGIVTVFLLEGLIIGLIGGALAAALGYILAGIFGQLQLFPQDNPRAYLRFERFPVSLDLSIYLATFGLSLLMAIVASILPARRAAKLVPVETIRKV
jgi:lipoprotein-releasing system permease protein